MVLRSPPDALPGWLPARLEAGFHTLEAPDGKSMRVFVRDDQDARVVVMQDMQLIDDVAEGSAAQTFIPALLLIPLVAWLSLRVLAAERRRVQAERRFIANAAHELRSPLTAISIQAENLDATALPPAALERLDALRGGINRAQRVAEQMLAMARLHSRAHPTEDVDVGMLVRQVISDALDLARRGGVDLGLDQRETVVVQGSQEMLALILKNGLENAIAHTGSGGAVTVRVRIEAGEAVVEVQDDGCGMPEDFVQHAFEPYRRAGPVASGAGLGLAIAMDAATKLGGTLAICNRPDARGVLLTYRQTLTERSYYSERLASPAAEGT